MYDILIEYREKVNSYIDATRIQKAKMNLSWSGFNVY